MQDPYAVLGVNRDADAETIRQAYRRLAKQYHPDLNPGDAYAARRMNEINEAYDLLKNPEALHQQQARQQYRQTYRQNSYDPFAAYQSQSRSYEQPTDASQSDYRYQQSYHSSRSPFGFVGKLILIYMVIELLFSMLGGCMALLRQPVYRDYWADDGYYYADPYSGVRFTPYSYGYPGQEE